MGSSSMDEFSRYIVGAYATSPTLLSWEPEKETVFMELMKGKLGKIRGLELPFFGCGVHPHDSELYLKLLDPEWEYVMTCLPGNMKELAENKHFGLASDDRQGRQQAVEYYKRASESIKELNNYFGVNKVFAVAIATSPALMAKGVSSSQAALEESLATIARFDWSGAELVIEHCDSGRLSITPVKGFISIEEELAAILAVKTKHSIDIGMTINWARSVIEARNQNGANQHILKAIKSGALRGLMFSGTSAVESIYGKWTDLHLPVAREPGIDYFEETSLMTAENMKSCLVDSGWKELSYLGVKVLAMPIIDATCERRVGVNFDTLKVLDREVKNLQSTFSSR